MRVLPFMLMVMVFLCLNDPGLCGDPEAGQAVGFLGGCEIDLNADGRADTALLIDTSIGYELVVLVKMGTAAKSFYLPSAVQPRHSDCGQSALYYRYARGIPEIPFLIPNSNIECLLNSIIGQIQDGSLHITLYQKPIRRPGGKNPE